MNAAAPPRRIVVCADDYGMADGINRAILDLIGKKRINATSVMTVAPAFTRESARLLQETAKAQSCQIGLHVTLTAPFRPLTMHYRPLHGDTFLALPVMMRTAIFRRLDRDMLRAEILAQIAAFVAQFGVPPDYLDGHQHVQIFPVVRDAMLDAIRVAAPNAWVRQCGRVRGAGRVRGDRKALLLDVLSNGFRARAAKAGIRTNPAFAGTYDFSRQGDFARLFAGFLDGLPDGGLVMCHPGFVDAQLLALDPFTRQREREHDYFAGEQYPALLAERNVALA